jgi:hypothetical protein
VIFPLKKTTRLRNCPAEQGRNTRISHPIGAWTLVSLLLLGTEGQGQPRAPTTQVTFQVRPSTQAQVPQSSDFTALRDARLALVEELNAPNGQATLPTPPQATPIGAPARTPGTTLPGLIAGYWFRGYGGPTMADVALAVPAANYQAWFAAVGTGFGGALTFNGVGTPSITDITNWKGQGKFVVMTIGGSASDLGSGATVTLNNASDLAQMEASIGTMVSTYGFQGVDIDLENDRDQWLPAVMAQLFFDLKKKYGQDFVIQIDPSPYQIRPGGIYAQLYALAGSNIDLVAPQWYSQPGRSDSWFISSYILPDLATLTGAVGIPSKKIVLGCSNAGGPPSGAATYIDAWNQWKLANSGKPLRGMIWFDTNGDPDWTFGASAATALQSR